MVAQIQAEPPGDYFIGRRYFKPDYHFWGYVRRPGQPWTTAQLVMLNENQKLAPDREQINFGFDNNYEYKLYGRFSGDKVYEPASNGVYPEFVLKGYELIEECELVANAAKHAYPNGVRGRIWVRLMRFADVAQVSVRDEGVGLPVDFATRKRVGLGMRLIHALVQQTEAKLRIERPERGTEFVLDISVKDE